MAAGYPYGPGRGLSNVPEVRVEEAGFADCPPISLLFVTRPQHPALACRLYLSNILCYCSPRHSPQIAAVVEVKRLPRY